MASALQPCLQQGAVGVSKEVCVTEVGASCINPEILILTVVAETNCNGQCYSATYVQQPLSQVGFNLE